MSLTLISLGININIFQRPRSPPTLSCLHLAHPFPCSLSGPISHYAASPSLNSATLASSVFLEYSIRLQLQDTAFALLFVQNGLPCVDCRTHSLTSFWS